MSSEHAGLALVASALLLSCGSKELQPPPPPVCGDGIVDPGEGCDAGDRNGRMETLCQFDCTLRETPPIPSRPAFDFPARRMVRDACIKPLPDLDGDGENEVSVRGCFGPNAGEIRSGLNGPVLFADLQPDRWTTVDLFDLDDDGNMDLISCALAEDFASALMTVLMGDGAGAFVQVSEITQVRGNRSDFCDFQVADLDRDGDQDIVLRDFTESEFTGTFAVRFLRNRGGRRFVEEDWQYIWSFFSLPYGFILGDMNGDRVVDIISYGLGADRVGGQSFVWQPVDEDGIVLSGRQQEMFLGPLLTPRVIDVSGTGRGDLVGLVQGAGFARIRYQGDFFDLDIALADSQAVAFDIFRDETQRLRMVMAFADRSASFIREFTSFDAATWRQDAESTVPIESEPPVYASLSRRPIVNGRTDDPQLTVYSASRGFYETDTAVGEPDLETFPVLHYGAPRFPWRVEPDQTIDMIDDFGARYERKGEIYWQPQTVPSLHQRAARFVACDFDGEGREAIVYPVAPDVMNVARLEVVESLAVTEVAAAVACTDFDADGREELITLGSDGALRSHAKLTSGFEIVGDAISTTSTIPLIADIDRDGLQDLIVGSDVYFGEAAGPFATRERGPQHGDRAAVAWSDDDGTTVARVGLDTTFVQLWEMSASGDFALTASIAWSVPVRHLVGRRGPSDDELVVVAEDGLTILSRDGTTRAVPVSERGWIPADVLTADLDADGIDEIVVALDSPSFSALPNRGFVIIPGTATSAADHVWFGAHAHPIGLIAADRNGDGLLDITAPTGGSPIPGPGVPQSILLHSFEQAAP